MLDRLLTRLLRRRLNAFAKSVISEAKQRRIIGNDAMHEIAGIIDRRLAPRGRPTEHVFRVELSADRR
jgi:hypothetical protein